MRCLRGPVQHGRLKVLNEISVDCDADSVKLSEIFRTTLEIAACRGAENQRTRCPSVNKKDLGLNEFNDAHDFCLE